MKQKSDMRAVCEAARAKLSEGRQPVREFAPPEAPDQRMVEFGTVESAMEWLRGGSKPSDR